MSVSVGSVQRCQTLVNHLGFHPALVLDGVDGPLTTTGIRWAQKLLGVVVDGVWGSASDASAQRRLAPIPTPGPPLFSKDVNVLATRWVAHWVGPKEQYGANDGPWLRAEEHSVGDDWMWRGHNPYCAEIGVRVAYQAAAGVNLHLDFPSVNWAYCPSIASAIRGGLKGGKRQWHAVAPEKLRDGDVVLFDWNGDGVADHVGHAVGSVSGGSVATIEANTGAARTEGIWRCVRSVGVILVGGRLL